MNTLKIAVYAICRNEEAFVARWMDSMQEADVVIVADTGSTDGTVAKLRERGAIVYGVHVSPWRFDVARNISLQLVPNDIDVCVCTDLDEVLEGGWRDKLEQAWQPNTTRMKYWYTWSFNLDGSPGTAFWYEKIHRRDGFRWTHPVHEVLQYRGEDPDVYVWESSIRLNHYPDSSKSRSSYLELLEMSVAENPEDDRNLHYLGREYLFNGKWEQAISTLTKHLELPQASWKDERCASMRYIARSYKELGKLEDASVWLYRSIAEAPYLREPYTEMAKLAYWKQDWPCVHHMVVQALRIKEKPASYINEAFCWNETLYDLGALSCFELGMLEKSLRYAKAAVDLAPNDPRLLQNYELIMRAVNSSCSNK